MPQLALEPNKLGLGFMPRRALTRSFRRIVQPPQKTRVPICQVYIWTRARRPLQERNSRSSASDPCPANRGVAVPKWRRLR